LEIGEAATAEQVFDNCINNCLIMMMKVGNAAELNAFQKNLCRVRFSKISLQIHRKDTTIQGIKAFVGPLRAFVIYSSSLSAARISQIFGCIYVESIKLTQNIL